MFNAPQLGARREEKPTALNARIKPSKETAKPFLFPQYELEIHI